MSSASDLSKSIQRAARETLPCPKCKAAAGVACVKPPRGKLVHGARATAFVAQRVSFEQRS